MARLPIVGEQNWGDVLNDYLLQSHNTDGTMRNGVVKKDTIVANSVTAAHIQDGVVAEQKLHSAVRTKLNTAAAPTYANLPAGTTLTVVKAGSTWPARPTSRNDIVVIWKGPEPSPVIISSGTGGMLNNVDIRIITP